VPARNIHHDAVVAALQADGWTITHDPLTIGYGGIDLYVDLGAERIAIGAEKGIRQIAVEIQSFLARSAVRALEEAVGQFAVYRSILRRLQPHRTLYLAVPQEIDQQLLSTQFGLAILEDLTVRVVVFDEVRQEVIRWSD